MPLYDYKCSKCGYVFEVQQRITEEPLKHCPKCKGQVRRIISPAGIIFKGSGFHVTDYKKGPGASSQPKKKESKKSNPSTELGVSAERSRDTKETKSSAKDSSPPKSK